MFSQILEEEEEVCTVDPYEVCRAFLNPDGTFARFELTSVPATTVDDTIPSENVTTKDVTINENTKTWMRLYLPKILLSNDNNVAKFPILLYFHLGSFLVFPADTVFVNEPCGRYSSQVPSIVASVNYRLAPEHRLPAAYEDAMDALVWIKNQALDPNGDPWLRDFADFARVFLLGIDAGANISYRTALLAQEVDLSPVRISGLIMNQPYFAGTKRTKSEIKGTNDCMVPLSLINLSVELALPLGSDRDHEYINPMVQGEYSKYIGSLPRVLIRGFEGDALLDRQIEFTKMLIKRGVQVTAYFGEDGFHCVDVYDPKRHLLMIKYIRDFI